MAIVVRLGPLPLQHRRDARITELERIFGTAIDLIEVSTVAELVTAAGAPDVIAVALDAPPPGQLAEAVAAAGSLSLPALRPLWRRKRNTRGETDEVFDGYGVLTGTDIVRLADGELSNG
jgi:hypothetical protein